MSVQYDIHESINLENDNVMSAIYWQLNIYIPRVAGFPTSIFAIQWGNVGLGSSYLVQQICNKIEVNRALFGKSAKFGTGM